MLVVISKCAGADWTEQNKFFQTLLNLSNLAFSNCSKNVLNDVKKFFFRKKLQELPSSWGLRPQDSVMVTCSFAHNFHNQQLLKLLIHDF